MIVKAIVLSNSSEDPEGKGRVRIESPGLWESFEDYFPVFNNTPLNVGDVVFVYLNSMVDVANPLVLGRSRDSSWDSIGSDPSGFSVLWESVYKGGWTVAYVKGSSLIIENSSGNVVKSVNGTIVVHDGSNGGVVNVSQIRSLARALLKDLSMVGSGSNLIEWFGSEYPKLEDVTFTH